jgi:uncharacterized protein (DUF1330 family)
MPAYVVVDVTVTDPEAFRTYMALAEVSLAEAGGRYLARGGETEVFEGRWSPRRLVVVEFPDRAAAKAWYEGAAYLAAREARAGAANMNMVCIEGYVPPT